MNLQQCKQKIDEFFNSSECDDYFSKLENKKLIEERQLEKFHTFANKSEIIRKIIGKYNSKNYIRRWLKRGYEPPEKLYWFLFSYSQKYGRECSEEEYSKYGNMFTSSMYYCSSFIFMQMDGQGSVVKIIELNDFK